MNKPEILWTCLLAKPVLPGKIHYDESTGRAHWHLWWSYDIGRRDLEDLQKKHNRAQVLTALLPQRIKVDTGADCSLFPPDTITLRGVTADDPIPGARYRKRNQTVHVVGGTCLADEVEIPIRLRLTQSVQGDPGVPLLARGWQRIREPGKPEPADMALLGLGDILGAFGGVISTTTCGAFLRYNARWRRRP
jgi:hypothetical protein